MRRKVFASIVASIFVFTLICNAIAEIDMSSMTDDELTAIITQAQQELNSRKGTDNGTEIVLYDSNNIKWYITGYEESSWSSYITFNSIVENNSSKDVVLSVDTMTVNGWDVSSFVYAQVSSGKKTKEDVSFDMQDASVESVNEITSIEIALRIYNGDTYQDIDQQHIEFTPTF